MTTPEQRMTRYLRDIDVVRAERFLGAIRKNDSDYVPCSMLDEAYEVITGLLESIRRDSKGDST